MDTVIDIGGFLKDARERRHLTIGQIANATKLPPAVFERIDRNEFDRLPGGVLTVECLRAYATEVGVDAELVVSAYVVHVRILRRVSRPAASAWALRNSRAGWWVTVAVLVIALCLILGSCSESIHVERRTGIGRPGHTQTNSLQTSLGSPFSLCFQKRML